MAERLQTIEIETGASPDASIIWLHGLGADGHDFEPIVPQLDIGQPLRFVFPHAPVRPITLNGGIPMRAWYDIVALDRRVRQDIDGIRDSRGRVEDLIAAEVGRGIPAGRIVLAGFSQGGAIALYAGLCHAERLAGVVGLSCWLPDEGGLAAERTPANRDVPIFMGHGSYDPMVSLDFGVASRDALLAAGHVVDWHVYPMPHSVCAEEIADLRVWLQRCLARPSAARR